MSKTQTPMSKLIEEEVKKKVAEISEKMIKQEEKSFQKFIEK